MKNSFFLLAFLSIITVACNKEKSLKDIYGSYTSDEFVIYDDSNGVVLANSMNINEVVGVGFSYSNDDSVPGSEFDFEAVESSMYDYKLTFKRTRLYYFNVNSGEMIELPSPSSNLLNEGRSFYLSKTDDSNRMLFSIVYDNGSTEVHTFTK